jgi:hypothetical protein
MSSVLAIVSKALFEKMIPKADAKVGVVVDTSQYVSQNKTFDGLKDGGAIFLVTVRPPDEKLWIVGVLENPTKKGDTWTAAANTAPITDVTSAIKKLKFASGAGLSPKKGALGMSLQTPRALTDADVALLRGMLPKSAAVTARVHASEAYAKAVDQVVHHKGGKLGMFRLENRRKPFKGKLEDLEDWERAQIQSVFGPTDDSESGEVKYQIMLWPFGDGTVAYNRTTKAIAGICQHGLDPREELSNAWVRDFGRAWIEGSKRLKMWTAHLDFDADDLAGDDDE